MKKLFSILLILVSFIGFSQEKKMYYRGDSKIDPSLIDENVGDSIKKVNTIFHFKNGTRSHYIKVMNLAGKTYAQGISEYVVLDFNSKKGGDLHRKVENLTHIKLEDGRFISDQLKFSFVFLKEKGVNYEKSMPAIKAMVCTKDKNSSFTSCRLNDDEVKIIPDEFPGKYPQSSFVRLGAEDLKNMKPKELDLMKKEIYARYGYRLPEKADMDYFFKQNWYEPIVDNKMIQLNEIEIDNMAMIDLYLGGGEYKSLNNKSYSYIFPLETTSSTLYHDKDILKSIKYTKQDSLSGNKCLLTDFNKQGISIGQLDCMTNKNNYVNYFKDNFLIQHVDQLNDTYYYYNDNGFPSKTVRLDYQTDTTEETYFTYDVNGNITKKDIYQNNDFNSTLYYEYDRDNNLLREYYKDEDGAVVMPVEFFYDDDNVKTGFLRNEEFQCDYSFNDQKDILTKSMCYQKTGKDTKEMRSKTENTVMETNRGKKDRLLSFKLTEYENYKYSFSITELKYY